MDEPTNDIFYSDFLNAKSPEEAEFFLKKMEADTNISKQVISSRCYALLQSAAERGDAPIIRWLTSVKKINPDANEGSEAALISLTPFELALEYQQVKCIEVLLDANAALPKTPMHRLFDLQQKLDEVGSSVRCIRIINLLKSRAVDQNKRDRRFGNTALHCAVSKLTPMSVIKYMVEQGADLFVKNYRGETVLDCAIKTAELYSEQLLPYLNSQITFQRLADSKENVEQASSVSLTM